ncbi:hypothetical protein BC939DRAFT_498204 [Gamsiella multidivaricata]|uniref:uncharacterized protein n=1 Tax=Gamsiella multidivaricata TaxID=101098 RepID=UPI00221EF8D6|nr:uncharacterized protein BC939DRAFT_498204 [Gamsiella multidivaricata]KAI7832809.1 hypothetical protein BC939DRAFT_498204 [Gamsiella multidivaricata]
MVDQDSELVGFSNASIEKLLSGPQSWKKEELASFGGPSTEMNQWVCKNIETLHIIMCGDSMREDGEEEEGDESEGILQRKLEIWEMQNLLFRRLGQLTRPKKLMLGWEMLGLCGREPAFSLRLRSGLKHLDKLKDLEVFHVCHFADEICTVEKRIEGTDDKPLFAGQEERRWIKKHWPKLKEFRVVAWS